MSTRVRFAPSPTGPLHIGGVRTALYNYLFAKKTGGKFILRIEDTDQKRYVNGSEKFILDSLRWLGLDYDEGPIKGGAYGPYVQSRRQDIYDKYVQKLLDDGKAYFAFDTPEELDKWRGEQKKKGVHSPTYNMETRKELRNSLTMTKRELKKAMKNLPFTIRLKVEPDQTIVFKDVIRGKVVFSSNELDDKVLIKADGIPTYHFANVVDDYEMKITHVIRGEEWISSTPHHVLLYQALGLVESMPQFVHLPLIMKPEGKGKLGKRDAEKFGIPVLPLDWRTNNETLKGFKGYGFLPEATSNFLALLGWSPGNDKEIMTMEELIEEFSLEKIGKAGAKFNFEKARWINQQHIQNMPIEKFVNLEVLKNYRGMKNFEEIADFIKPRVKTLNDIPAEIWTFAFAPSGVEDTKSIMKHWDDNSKIHYTQFIEIIHNMDNFSRERVEATTRSFVENNNLKFSKFAPLLRIGISGINKGPDLFKTYELIGKDEVVARLRASVNLFNKVK